MDIEQPARGERPTADEFRTRNDELFARRHELQDRLSALRARADTGELDMLSELVLRRVEREFDDLTLEIMIANFGLVRRYVTMFTSKSSEHIEDFESAGKVGLLWAIASYDPNRGPFASWAFKPIQREVLRAVRDADHPNLNPGDFEKRPAILAAERAFLEEAGPDAPVDHADIARRAGVTEAQVRRVLDAPGSTACTRSRAARARTTSRGRTGCPTRPRASRTRCCSASTCAPSAAAACRCSTPANGTY